jgi:phospholipase C
MENKTPAQALAGTYTKALATQYSLATNYHGVGRPSLPNYLALTSGQTFGIQDNGYRAVPDIGIGRQLTDARIPWRAYMEGLTAGCFDSPYPYALRHNPFAFYGGACPSNVVPLTQLDADLRSNTPRFVWITPDLCHDGHDCAVEEADAWLARLVPKILASPAWRSDGVLFVVWDEGDPQLANQMPLIVVTPQTRQRESVQPYDHYSLLATMEDLLGVPRLGMAASAKPLFDLVAGVRAAP